MYRPPLLRRILSWPVDNLQHFPPSLLSLWTRVVRFLRCTWKCNINSQSKDVNCILCWTIQNWTQWRIEQNSYFIFYQGVRHETFTKLIIYFLFLFFMNKTESDILLDSRCLGFKGILRFRVGTAWWREGSVSFPQVNRGEKLLNFSFSHKGKKRTLHKIQHYPQTQSQPLQISLPSSLYLSILRFHLFLILQASGYPSTRLTLHRTIRVKCYTKNINVMFAVYPFIKLREMLEESVSTN